jgi:hypothetical protein
MDNSHQSNGGNLPVRKSKSEVYKWYRKYKTTCDDLRKYMKEREILGEACIKGIMKDQEKMTAKERQSGDARRRLGKAYELRERFLTEIDPLYDILDTLQGDEYQLEVWTEMAPHTEGGRMLFTVHQLETYENRFGELVAKAAEIKSHINTNGKLEFWLRFLRACSLDDPV